MSSIGAGRDLDAYIAFLEAELAEADEDWRRAEKQDDEASCLHIRTKLQRARAKDRYARLQAELERQQAERSGR